MSKRIPIGLEYLEKSIIQGGMGIGVSLGDFTGAIVKEGGVSVISTAYPGYHKENLWKDPLACNIRTVYEEVAKTRAISGDRDLLGINVMVASHHYEDYMKATIGTGVDVIVSGVGMPMDLPSIEGNDQAALVPVVSSGRAACLTLKGWDRHYHHCPDFIVVKGNLAGGHLGFKKEELLSGEMKEFSELVCEVLREIQACGELYQTSIPVFVVDGVYTREDITTLLSIGTGGVQMATRFIITTGCGVDLTFKQKIVSTRKGDTTPVTSPTRLPGCTAVTASICSALKGRIASKHCIGCTRPCVPTSMPYYISDALVHSVEDDMEDGLVFVGANA